MNAAAMAVAIAAVEVVKRPDLDLKGAIGAVAGKVEHETRVRAALTGVAAMEVDEEAVGGRPMADMHVKWLSAVGKKRPGCQHTLPECAVRLLLYGHTQSCTDKV